MLKDPEKGRLNDLLVTIGNTQDENAFAEIYKHFAGRVKSFLIGKGMNEEIAEELMQEIMITVWRRSDSYDPTKAAASTWIFTIARNRRIDFLRGNSRIEVELDDTLLEHASESQGKAATLEDEAILRDQSSTLAHALELLPKEQRQVMHLSYFRGQSHGDIAVWLNLPIGTVKSRIRLAMQSVRSTMQITDPEPSGSRNN